MRYEYQCQQCQLKFNSDEETDSCSPEISIKCPSCGNTDIEIVGTTSSVYELLTRFIGSGGG